MKLKVYNTKLNLRKKLPKIYIHGRFQPPLHINHWAYVSPAFKLADKVIILITNPYQKEGLTARARHRSKQEHNPFTYKQRVQIFKSFFKSIGIPPKRYKFKPFEIKNKKIWSKVLNNNIPNLVSTYGSPWSKQKFKDFKEFGGPVIRINLKRQKGFSGTKIGEVLNKQLPKEKLKLALIKAGYVKGAIPGLFKVIN